MTPEKMRENSSAKVKQVMALMEMLHIKVEARQRINEQGFIDNTIFWIDNEAYPQPVGNTPAKPVAATGPTGETHA